MLSKEILPTKKMRSSISAWLLKELCRGTLKIYSRLPGVYLQRPKLLQSSFLNLNIMFSHDVFSLVYKNSMEIMVRNRVREILPEVRIERGVKK